MREWDLAEQVREAARRWRAALKQRAACYHGADVPLPAQRRAAEELREAEAALRAALAAQAERQKKAGGYRFDPQAQAGWKAGG